MVMIIMIIMISNCKEGGLFTARVLIYKYKGN